ncbi:MAG: hypothetical protein WAN81_13525 [Candidatus Binataceae bacterium]
MAGRLASREDDAFVLSGKLAAAAGEIPRTNFTESSNSSARSLGITTLSM